jgi:hypothetical protein
MYEMMDQTVKNEECMLENFDQLADGTIQFVEVAVTRRYQTGDGKYRGHDGVDGRHR